MMQSPSPEGVVSAPRRPGLGVRLLALRLPAIETHPAAVAFVQTWAGRVVLFLAFAALMKLSARGMWMDTRDLWLWMTAGAVVVSWSGRHRHLALLCCTAVLLARAPDWFEYRAVWTVIRQENVLGISYLRLGTLIGCVPLAAMAMFLARRYREHPLGRRPVLVQHIVYFVLLALAVSNLLHGLALVLVWSVLVTFSAYFAYLAYALIDQRHRRPAPVTYHLATFTPFAWPTTIPMGKGAANWRSVEAATPQELAVTQLKALKLLAWALFLKYVLWVYRAVIYQALGVPPLKVAFETFLNGAVAPPLGLWSVIANFPEQLLIVSVWGHMLVALARLAGFRLLRNTARPLSARTIAEFWNRYLYYFKEVLVDVYFYPTYVRYFKRHPRLRIAFATFMAAGVGNFILHFFLETQSIVEHGVAGALIRMQGYAFYCALLVAGIVLSQLRARRPDANAGWLRGRLAPSLGVGAFFCLLSFFDGTMHHVSLTLAQHFQFLFQVTGVNRWV